MSRLKSDAHGASSCASTRTGVSGSSLTRPVHAATSRARNGRGLHQPRAAPRGPAILPPPHSTYNTLLGPRRRSEPGAVPAVVVRVLRRRRLEVLGVPRTALPRPARPRAPALAAQSPHPTPAPPILGLPSPSLLPRPAGTGLGAGRAERTWGATRNRVGGRLARREDAARGPLRGGGPATGPGPRLQSRERPAPSVFEPKDPSGSRGSDPRCKGRNVRRGTL